MADWDHDLVVRIGGDSAAGGIVTTGEVFARIASFVGLEIYTTRTIPAEIKGGHVMFQVRTADRPIHSQGDELDLLVAYDQESFDRYFGLLKKGGVFVYNSNDLTPPSSDQVKMYGLPLTDLARQISFARGRNIILIGALVKLFDLPYDRAVEVVRQQLGRKKEMLEQNLTALQTGYRWVEENIGRESPFHLRGGSPAGDVEPRESGERLLLSGNQALAIGAIAAGCRFFAGYPITPASDIMEFLAAEFPKIGGTMIQAEDEIAAIGMTLGAAYTGVRAMTATSGPGLALMVEMLGHASMTETPLVIVDVQRAGPSTGMPTKVSQGDLRLAVFGGNDDAPRFVVAPVSVQDCFYQMINAFNLAEKYQTPVLFLSDQDMSVRVQTIPPFDLLAAKLEPRLLWDPAGDRQDKYERYADTPSGVSPMSLPGMPGGQYTAEGLEHYASGAPGYDPTLHVLNMQKRYRKLESALPDIEAWGMYEQFGDDDAAIGVIGWGSTIGPVREAVALAKDRGIPVAVFYPKALFPLPDGRLKAFLEKRQAVIVPEMNFTGQFAGMLRARAHSYGIERPIVKLNEYGGVPFTMRQVYEQIAAVHETLK